MMRRLAAEAVSLFCWFYVFFLLCEIKFCIFALKNPLFQPDLSNFQVLTQYNTNNMQTKSLQLRKLWVAALFILCLCLAGMTKTLAQQPQQIKVSEINFSISTIGEKKKAIFIFLCTPANMAKNAPRLFPITIMES